MHRTIIMQRRLDGDFHPVDGVLEDILKAGEKATSALLQQGKAAASGPAAKAAIEDFIRSSAFGKILDKVEEKAREGVTAEATKNAFPLVALAVGGGVVGGTLLRGVPGKIIAGLIMVWAVTKIMNPTATPPPSANRK